jgi:hypothetical protein
VPYEYPSGRRVNALAAYEPLAAEPWLGSRALERTLTSTDVLAYLRDLPAAAVPRVSSGIVWPLVACNSERENTELYHYSRVVVLD